MPTPDYYCNLQDVNNLVTQVKFTPTSKPSEADVQGMIASVARLIDANLSQIYVVPVVPSTQYPATVSLQLLRDLCAWGVAGRAQEIRNTGTTPEAQGVKSVWTKKFEEWLEMLADPSDPFILPDAQKQADFVEKLPGEIVDAASVSYPFLDHDRDGADGEGRLGRPHIGQVY
jgi:hypothetical protein